MAAKGSFLFKLLILVFILVLVAVIYIPDQIWTQENNMERVSRENMNTLYEAQHYYFNRTKSHLPSDSLSQLIEFIRSDSSLLEKQKIGSLTHVLLNGISGVLEIPTLKAMAPISDGVAEINGDLDFNTRYFSKYDHILQQKEDIKVRLKKFETSLDYPNFNTLKLYTDSLKILQDRINERSLQEGTQLTQSYVDSIQKYLPNAEIDAFQEFWKTEYDNISNLIKDIKATDIVLVSSVADRLKKFIDRVNTGMAGLAKVNIQQDVQAMDAAKSKLGDIYTQFTQPENLFTTQKNGIVQLSEVDSILVKFNESHFYDPDTIDGEQVYLFHYKDTTASLIVESPNLLDDFQQKLNAAAEPIKNLSVYPFPEKIQSVLDSISSGITAAKDKHRLARYSTDLLLDIKELTTEMQDISNLRFVRYSNNLKSFVDTIKTEKRLSALKPLINDYILTTGIDSLASRIEKRDVSELTEKMDYFGEKIKNLDSMLVASVPNRVSRQIPPFSDTFAGAYSAVEELKSAINPDDGEKIRQASADIQNTLTEILNGYQVKVFGVFDRKHVNHGYIENGQKSWELESE